MLIPAIAVALLIFMTSHVAAFEESSDGGDSTHGMDHKSALVWTLALSLILGAVHVGSPFIRRLIQSRERSVGSFGGGMAAGYVFIHLLAELDKGHALFGERIHVCVLIGFLAYYGGEYYVATHQKQTNEETPGRFRVEILLAWLYSWLLVYTLPDLFAENGLAILPVVAAVILHVCFVDSHLGHANQVRFDKWGRFVLATAPLVGWITDLFYFDDDPAVSDILTALMAGSVIYKLFRHELPHDRESSFGWFVSGATVFLVLDLIAH